MDATVQRAAPKEALESCREYDPVCEFDYVTGEHHPDDRF